MSRTFVLGGHFFLFLTPPLLLEPSVHTKKVPFSLLSVLMDFFFLLFLRILILMQVLSPALIFDLVLFPLSLIPDLIR